MANSKFLHRIIVYVSIGILMLFYMAITKKTPFWYDYKQDAFFVFPILALVATICLYSFYFRGHNRSTPFRTKIFDIVGITLTFVLIVWQISIILSYSVLYASIMAGHAIMILLCAYKSLRTFQYR
jgi:hypothetical protein